MFTIPSAISGTKYLEDLQCSGQFSLEQTYFTEWCISVELKGQPPT